MRVGRKGGKLAELELAPGVRIEPFGVIAAGRVERLADLGDVVGMRRIVVDRCAFPTLDLPPAGDDIEERGPL